MAVSTVPFSTTEAIMAHKRGNDEHGSFERASAESKKVPSHTFHIPLETLRGGAMSTKYRRRRHERGLRRRRRGARSSCSEWRTGQKKRAKITHKRAGKRFERLVRPLPELRVEEAMVVRAVEKGGRGEEAEEVPPAN